MRRLRRSDCTGPGVRRRGRGRGFEYLDESGAPISDPETIERLRSLAIPPAWKDVWICSDPLGHLQATGIDAAGRKQYLYHQRWRERRDQQKFDEMLDFARALPRLRRRVAADLAGGTDDATRGAVLACAVRLLDLGFFRIGGEGYAEQNETYGLATLRRDHLTIRNGEAEFEYTAKGGQDRVQVVRDTAALKLLRRLRRRRSDHPELLAYKERGRWRDVRSEDINQYVKEAAGDEFSAKDFRTWNATVMAAAALAKADRPGSSAARRRAVSEAMAEVAELLGNTPAVCRNSYVDPRVIDRFVSGVTIPARSLAGRTGSEKRRRAVERAVIRLIEG